MRRRQPCGPEPGDGTKTKCHHRHLRHLVGDEVERRGFGQAAGQVGTAGGLDGLHRASPARPLDQPDDGHAELGGDFLRHPGLALDGGIGGPAAEGEIVAGDDDRAAIDGASAEHAVGRDEAGDVAVRPIGRLAGDAADLLEAAGVEHAVDAFAHRHASAFMLARHAVLAAEFACERLAVAQFRQFHLPADAGGVRSAYNVVGHAFPIGLLGSFDCCRKGYGGTAAGATSRAGRPNAAAADVSRRRHRSGRGAQLP
jgi:hypothetical protein